MGKGFVMLTMQRHTQPSAAMILLMACLPLQASASEIATNMRLSFNEIAIISRTTSVSVDGADITTYSDNIDKLLTLDASIANTRLLSSRLGTFSSGSMTIDLRGNQFISINDPGVSVLPDTQRNVTRIEAGATLSGGLLNTPESLNLDVTWFCRATVLYCTSEEVYSTSKFIPTLSNSASNAAAMLQPIRLQASGTTTFTADGVSINYAGLSLSGTLNVNATFTAKTRSQYVADAIAATPGAGGGDAAARWHAAAADIQSLRNSVLTDVAVANTLKIVRTPELQEAQTVLAAARDSATLLNAGATVPTMFNSPFDLMRQLWNVTATVDPSLGRSMAGFSSEDLTSDNAALSLAALSLIASGSNEHDFASRLDPALGVPLATSAAPQLTLDGALLGLNNAMLSIYYLGNSSSGLVELNLPDAGRYALLRNGLYDRISLLEGNSLTVIGASDYAGSEVLQGEEVYIGEVSSGLLELSGQSTASRLQLNNIYSNQFLVVASWAVTPVPEPSQAWLLMMGLPLILRRRQPH
jgi:hypothetical protein